MIIILLKKITATALALSIAASGAAGYFHSDNLYESSKNSFTISANAANVKVAQPKLKLVLANSDRVYVSITNLNQFNGKTVFNLYINNRLVRRNITYASLKKGKGYIIFMNDGVNHLKANTRYQVKVNAVCNKTKSACSPVLNVKTPSATYFNINNGTPIYSLRGKKMSANTRASSRQAVKGGLSTDKGVLTAGKALKNNNAAYIRILEGKYKGKYVKSSDSRAYRITSSDYKRRIVSEYAASMNGGSYVWGGASYKATDCSGLTMQAYARIGVNLPHSSNAQASCGRTVSRNNMLPGDILILNGGGHIAMYIGNNQMVHAMNYYDGIKIQPVSYLQYYTVNDVRRII